MDDTPLKSCTDYERLLVEMSDSSRDVVVIADWNRCISFVNDVACEKTGYKKKELVGARIPILYPEKNRACYTSKIYAELRKQGRWIGEIDVRKKDGTTFHANTVVIAIHDHSGRATGTIGFFHDLSEQRLLEQYVWRSELHLQTIIDSMEDGLYVCDVRGKILMCNEMHSQMTGYQKEEVVGVIPPYPWIDSADNLKLRHGLKLLVKEKKLKNFILKWRRRDNTAIVASLALSFLSKPVEATKAIVVSVRDKTDVQYAEDLRRANEQIHRLVADVKRKAERLETLQLTNSLVLQNADNSSIFKAITSGVKKLVEHDLAGIYVYEPEQRSFVAHTLSKQTRFSRQLAKFPIPLGEGIIGQAALSGKVVWVNNAQQDPRARYPEGMRPEREHFIAVPLRGRESIFGVLVVARNRDPQFIEEEALVVQSFADAATVALENARLFHELNKYKHNGVEHNCHESLVKRVPSRTKTGGVVDEFQDYVKSDEG